MKKIGVWIVAFFLVVYTVCATEDIWNSYDQTGVTTWSDTNDGAQTVITVINNSFINRSASEFRLVAVPGNDFGINYPTMGFCERSGQTEDCVDDPVQVFWDGSPSLVNGTTYASPGDYPIYSDPISYDLDSSKDYLLKTWTAGNYQINRVGSGTITYVDNSGNCTLIKLCSVTSTYYDRSVVIWKILSTAELSDVQANFSNAYYLGDGQSFDILLNVTNNNNEVLCDFNINGSLLGCDASYVQSNSTNTTNCSILGEGEEHLNVELNCTGGGFSKANNYSVWVDNVQPVFTGSTFTNNSLTVSSQNISGVFNFSDSNLFRINATVGDVDVWSLEGINQTSYSAEISFNASDFGVGNYTLNITAFDSHTSKSLKENYNVKRPIFGSALSFKTSNNEIEITADSKGLSNPFAYKKLKDRYTFTYNAPRIEDSYVFRVRTQKPMHLVRKPNTKIGQWLVSGNNWIDFYLESEPGASVSYKLVTPKLAIVTVSGLASPLKQAYSSVGELNSVTVLYDFAVYNATLTYTPSVVTGQTQTAKLKAVFPGAVPEYNVSFYYDSQLFDVDVNEDGTDLYVNSTFITPSINGTNKSVNGIFSLNTSSQNYFNFSAIIYNAVVDDCSFATAESINISIFLEEYPDVSASASVDAVFEYWVTPTAIKNASFNVSGSSSYVFCLYPSNVTVQTDAYFKYLTSDGFTHRYYLVNETLSNDTLYLNMYNFNRTEGVSDIKITSRYKSNYDPFPSVYAQLQRFYPAEFVWRTVQMDQSGDYGSLFFNVIEESVDYRLRYYDEEFNLLKQTERLKFLCDSGVCDVTVLLQPVDSVEPSINLIVNSVYDNSTGQVYVLWDDPDGRITQIRYRVSKNTMASTVNICEGTSAGASGNISCNVSSHTGNIQVKVWRTASPEESAYEKTYNLVVSNLYDFIGDDSGSIAATLLLVTVIMFGASLFSVGIGIMSMIFGLMIIYYLGLMSAMSATFLVIVCMVGLMIGLKVRR